ncbi:MAG: T9SS type A sorting domain-containing protein [Saprospiraceae bacterium]|nr:T9SS type A sorting domain-containing protein [Saprospiraceae bacterium]
MSRNPISRHSFWAGVSVCLFFLLAVPSLSVAQVDWQQSFGKPNITESVIRIFPGEDNNQFWMAGQTGSVGQDDLFLMLVDSFGNTLWADTFGSPDHNELIVGFDRNPNSGTMWISANIHPFQERGYGHVYYGFDKNGLFQTNFSLPNNDASNILEALNDGGLLTMFKVGSQNYTLQKFDKDGNLIFRDYINPVDRQPGQQALESLPDGRFFVMTTEGYFRDTLITTLRFRNPDNSTIWEQQISSDIFTTFSFGGNLTFIEEDSTLLVHHFFTSNQPESLSKFDISGQKLWEVTTASSRYADYLREIQLNKSGLIGLVHNYRIEWRDLETGVLIDTIQYPEKSIEGGCFGSNGHFYLVENLENDGLISKINLSDKTTSFEKRIGISGPDDTEVYPFLAETDGNLFLLNLVYNEGNAYQDLELRKLDLDSGNEIWKKTFGDTLRNFPEDLAKFNDGSILIASSARVWNHSQPDSMHFLRINPLNGDILWQGKFENRGSTYNLKVATLPDNGFVALFQGVVPIPNNPNGVYGAQIQGIKVDGNGNQIWRKWFEPTWSSNSIDSGQRLINDVTLLDDGTVVVAGMEDYFAGLLLHINPSDGQLINAFQFDSIGQFNDRRFSSVIETNAGEWVAASLNYNFNDPLWIYKIDRSGEVLIKKDFLYGRNHYGSRLVKGNDGGIFLLLSYEDGPSNDQEGLKILRLNENLEITSTTNIYDHSIRNESAIGLNDHSIAVSFSYQPTNSDDILVIKTGALPLVKSRWITNENQLLCYPNPIENHNIISLQLPILLESKAGFKIYDLNGKLHYSQSLYPQANKVFEIQIPNLSPGIYAIQLQNETINWTGKLVVR